MTTYAMGDVQGCYDTMRYLLDKVDFDPALDKLWLVGDLINRGPKNVQTLRFVKSLGDRAIVVLGNHDLHFLAVAHGIRRRVARDTFKDIQVAADRGELIDWLRLWAWKWMPPMVLPIRAGPPTASLPSLMPIPRATVPAKSVWCTMGL